MKVTLAFVPLFVVLFFSGCATTGTTGTRGSSHGGAHTPAKGTPERTAIIDGVKKGLAKQGMKDVLVAVPYLEVHDGWAWVRVHPKSADGTQDYEFQSGLLQREAKVWTVREWMPAEEGTDSKAYFAGLKKRYPAAPADIFPE